MGWDFMLPLLRHDDDWRLQRKICHLKFRQGDAEKYFPMQIEKVHELLRNLLEKPKDFETHNKMLDFLSFTSDLESLTSPYLDFPSPFHSLPCMGTTQNPWMIPASKPQMKVRYWQPNF